MIRESDLALLFQPIRNAPVSSAMTRRKNLRARTNKWFRIFCCGKCSRKSISRSVDVFTKFLLVASHRDPSSSFFSLKARNYLALKIAEKASPSRLDAVQVMLYLLMGINNWFLSPCLQCLDCTYYAASS